MKLPAHVPLSDATLHEIAARHGLRGATVTRPPEVGIINAIYLLGDDYVLRVPRNHPAHVRQLRTELLAIPAALAAGVRTPNLVAADESCDLIPVPYAIVERVHGATLGLLDRDPGDTIAAWRELGIDLALLHTGVTRASPAAQLRASEPPPDPRLSAEERARDGWFTTLEARWLIAWLERLAPAALTPVPARLLHLDVQATNLMVDPATLAYRAILDWGCAGWGDSAWDCFGLPLRAIPHVLAGHRSIAPLDADDTAEARILWRHLQFSLHVLPRGATPGLSWGEHPLAWLLETMRFFLDRPQGVWRDLAP
jgi:aminoglycoside phosphotransferase (APT) family kinase protein